MGHKASLRAGITGPAGLSRRELLVGAMAMSCARPAPRRLGGVLFAEDATRGHRLREPYNGLAEGPADKADICIIGAGIAGLAAAWRLRRAGFTGAVEILELSDVAGGTARCGDGDSGPFALGAHYITLPNPEARHMMAMLADFGVITGFDSGGRPAYSADALCLAPEERLFVGGEWIEGLWPEPVASPEDAAQYAAFVADVARWQGWRGADGLPAFSIPVAGCSLDPAARALAGLSFADWLDQQGYTAPVLRWWLEYATRDDFGASLADTSAWAGLHYHCARRPEAADAQDLGTHVLTWPGGNGWLVDRLVRAVPWRIRGGALVRQVEVDGDAALVHYEQAGQAHQLRARHVIVAIPSHVADHLIKREVPTPRPDYAPWRVAAISVDQPPASRGLELAWDSVLYQARGLGVVSSAHQTGRYGGPSVLTWYEPLWQKPPAEGRAELLAEPWEATVDRALRDLAPGHADLAARVQRVDTVVWGHGTVRPVPGMHSDPASLGALAAQQGPVSFAHTDLSGLSLFEEASFHGVRAAEEALTALTGVCAERLAG